MDTIPQNTPTKQCKDCKECFPATTEYFYVGRSYKYGVIPRCKPCEKIRLARDHQKHREERLAQKKAYYEAHREEDNARSRAYHNAHREENIVHCLTYRQNNKERIQAVDKAYKQNHKEERQVYDKAYRKSHRAERNSYYHNRRARILGNGGTHTAEDVQKQYANQKGRCYYAACGHKKLGKNRSDYEVDHVIPLSRGGSNDPSNLVITCHACNDAKRAKLPHEWTEGGRLL